MLVVIGKPGADLPTVRCDHCWTRIERGGDGRAVWGPTEPAKPYSEVRFLHARCLEAYRRKSKIDFESMNLGGFVQDLAANLKVDAAAV